MAVLHLEYTAWVPGIKAEKQEEGHTLRPLPVSWLTVNMAQAVQKLVSKVPALIGSTSIYLPHRFQS